ncbi:hypothetical protein [Microbacterium radiodurans]|uniref:Uncharacterized protein n=1 Tax=Microbacterium radiodurans TaxID=661398 RepID=A0A5J5IPN1_9MICO|nr:hypothetical protein [Microbacterium radiodurans]KAA9085422.1 hypothetical protein F6B42_13240 [Microbacterium radiodurans]
MTRADKYPDQAEADMNRLQEEARVADDAKDEAVARAEELERQIDSAFIAGDHALVETLQDQHQQAEIEIDNTKREFESVMDQVGNSQRFWYEEEDDDDDED